MGVWVVTGSSYPGGFIGDQESEKAWLSEKVTVIDRLHRGVFRGGAQVPTDILC